MTKLHSLFLAEELRVIDDITHLDGRGDVSLRLDTGYLLFVQYRATDDVRLYPEQRINGVA